jgi:hypothetical protein
LTKLGYLTPVPRFEKYQLAPSAMSPGYATFANLGVRHLSETYREEVMRDSIERSGETVARHGFAISANGTGVFFCRKRMDNRDLMFLILAHVKR